MNSILDYNAILAKLSAMRRSFLDESDFENIVSLSSIKEVLEYLQKNPYYKGIFSGYEDDELEHRDSIERILARAMYVDYEKLYNFSKGSQRAFLKLYFERYEVAFLKSCLNRLYDNRGIVDNINNIRPFFKIHSTLDLSKLSDVKNVNEFIDYLNGTRYSKGLAHLKDVENPSIFDYEMALDVFVFNNMWALKDKLLTGVDKRELTKCFGSKYDMLNLLWIYRCKQYYSIPNASIYSMLIPIKYKLKTDEIMSLVNSDNMDSFSELAGKTYYFKKYGIQNISEMESNYSHIMDSILRTCVKNAPKSVASLYSYLYQKDHQIASIIVAIECVRYSLPKQDAMKHIKRA